MQESPKENTSDTNKWLSIVAAVLFAMLLILLFLIVAAAGIVIARMIRNKNEQEEFSDDSDWPPEGQQQGSVSDQTVLLGEGKPFAQGIVVRYEVPDGAESEGSRNGGFGSTDR